MFSCMRFEFGRVHGAGRSDAMPSGMLPVRAVVW